MNTTEVHDYTDPLNVVAGVLMITNGAIGVVCNVSIVYIFWRAPTERTAFNLICVCRAISNSIILLWAFLATFVPIAFLHRESKFALLHIPRAGCCAATHLDVYSGTSPFTALYESIVIGCVNTIYMFIQNTGVLIAFNRVCAVFFPLYYRTTFSLRYTALITAIFFMWKAVSICRDFYYFLPLKCYMTFSSSELAWVPTFEPECSEDDNATIYKTGAVVCLTIGANMATFFKIYLFYKSTKTNVEETRKKMRKNKVLFVQTVIQDTITLIDMIFTFRISLLSTERYWTFISGSLIWETVHSLDGFIMMMFNERLSFLKKSIFSSSVVPSAPNSKIFFSTRTQAVYQ